MGRVRKRDLIAHEVELSPTLRALIVPDDRVVLFDRARGATLLTYREAQVLANAVGTTDKVDLSKQGSG